MKSIMFVGVRGVGKTTLVTKLADILSLPHFDYGDFMLDVMGTQDKDKIEVLTPSERQKVIEQVQHTLKERLMFLSNESSFLLLENHLTVTINGKIHLPIIENFRLFRIAGLCLVYAKPNDILLRRKRDDVRTRLAENVELISEQQTENDRQAQIIATLFKIPIIKLFNNNNLPLRQAEIWTKKLMGIE